MTSAAWRDRGYWDGFGESAQSKPGSDRKKKGKEMLLIPMQSKAPSVANWRAPSKRNSCQMQLEDEKNEIIRSAVTRMRQEVQDLNATFNASIEYMKRGAELSLQAARKKIALNKEFDIHISQGARGNWVFLKDERTESSPKDATHSA
jgi:hypothetical protein